jgi:hypothetical protein
MSKTKDSKANGSAEYEVGYRQPPLNTRFKLGKSGNPNGRPKGTLNFKTDVKEVLKAPVKVTSDGRSKNISTQRAALLRLREKALSGDARALDKVIQLSQIYNNEEVSDLVTALATDDAAALEVFKQRVRSGAVGDAAPTKKCSDSSSTSEDRDEPHQLEMNLEKLDDDEGGV